MLKTTSVRYISATRKFAVFVKDDPVTAFRLPVSMYVTVCAVEAAAGDEAGAELALCNTLNIGSEKATDLIDAAVRVGVVRRGTVS